MNNESNYDIRICTYQKANGRLQTNITCGNGKKLTRMVDAPYMRVRIMGQRIGFVPAQDKVVGETIKVSDVVVAIGTQELCQKLQAFDGEYTARVNASGMWYIDTDDRSLVSRRSRNIPTDVFKEPVKKIPEEEADRKIRKSPNYRVDALTSLVQDQKEVVDALRADISSLEKQAEQIMQQMSIKEQILKTQEDILGVLSAALEKIKGVEVNECV